MASGLLRAFRSLPDMRSAASQTLRFGGGLAGAGAGAATAEPDATPGEQFLRGAAGAVGGGYAVPGFLRAMSVAKTGPDIMTNALYFNYLSSPDTIMRANLGAVGGVLNHAFEEALQGLWAGSEIAQKEHFKNANDAFHGVWSGIDKYVKVLRGSKEEVEKLRRETLGKEFRFEVGEEFRDIGLGKWYTAGDIAAVEAMKKAGMPVQDAMRYTLTGTPETEAGQMVVGFQSKLLRDPGTGPAAYAKRLAMATAMPFARVGVVGAEQGLKRLPLLSPALYGKGSPADIAKTRAQGILGLGSGTAGYAAEEYLDPRISQTLGTLTGPAFLPFAAGRGLHRALRRDPGGSALRTGAAGIGGLTEGISEFNPLGYQPLGILRNFESEIPRRFIPSAVSDVAEAMDPAFGRITAGSELESLARRNLIPGYQASPGVGAFMGKIPGLRESLPEQYIPVGPTGEPRFSSAEVLPGTTSPEGIGPTMRGLSRTFFPSRQRSIPPVVDMSDPKERALYHMGISRQAPSPTGSLMGMTYRPTQAGASEMQRLRGLGPGIAGDVLTSAPMLRQIEQLSQSNPQLAQWLAQQMYSTITRGVGQGTGLAANLIGLQGGRGPFGGTGG